VGICWGWAIQRLGQRRWDPYEIYGEWSECRSIKFLGPDCQALIALARSAILVE